MQFVVSNEVAQVCENFVRLDVVPWNMEKVGQSKCGMSASLLSRIKRRTQRYAALLTAGCVLVNTVVKDTNTIADRERVLLAWLALAFANKKKPTCNEQLDSVIACDCAMIPRFSLNARGGCFSSGSWGVSEPSACCERNSGRRQTRAAEETLLSANNNGHQNARRDMGFVLPPGGRSEKRENSLGERHNMRLERKGRKRGRETRKTERRK